MDWIASMHALLNHLPVAVGLLLPWPLVAGQRPGRGMRPWWTVSRYLAVAGTLGLLLNLLSGPLLARQLGLPWAHRVPFRALLGEGAETLVLRHALLAFTALALAVAVLWLLTRPRHDHQGLGVKPLFLGLVWCGLLVATGKNGHDLVEARRGLPRPTPIVMAEAPRATPAPVESSLLRLLDHAALVSIHPEAVRSPAHGGRWVRAWVSPEAAAAYREGAALPVGALVVLSTQEERRGLAGASGPLYALEMTPTGPSLSFYWSRIPEERRGDFGGESRVYWRGREGRLDSCLTCHAAGMADPATRSRFRYLRRETPAP